MEKKRINVYLDLKVVELAHLETDNLSELVNNLLENYMSVSSTKGVDEEIQHHEKVISVLKEKKRHLLLAGASEDKMNGMVNGMLGELQKAYVKRREQVNDSDADFQWINSPKNQQRCKLLGKEPLVVAMELREWFKKTGWK
jgi:hypothetical protein